WLVPRSHLRRWLAGPTRRKLGGEPDHPGQPLRAGKARRLSSRNPCSARASGTLKAHGIITAQWCGWRSEEPVTAEKVTRASEKLLSKLQEVHATLEHQLEAPFEVLELLVTAVSKGEEPTETWELLHSAAERDGKIQELAFAYENVAADKRVRLLTADQQAYIYLWAVHFFGGQFGDAEGALAYGQRALAVDPSHQLTFEALEYFLADSPSLEKLAPLYLKAAEHETDPARRLALLLRASELVAERPAEDDLARRVYELLLAADPRDFGAREALAARHLQMRQPHEAAKLFEQALEVKPPLEPEQQRDVRERLIDLYQSTLG